MKPIRLLAGMLAALALAGCGGQKEPPRQEMTQQQRDSAIAESNLPGARGVAGAMAAQDSAAARRRLEDSIASADDN